MPPCKRNAIKKETLSILPKGEHFTSEWNERLHKWSECETSSQARRNGYSVKNGWRRVKMWSWCLTAQWWEDLCLRSPFFCKKMTAGFFIFTRHSERLFEEEASEFGYYQILKIASLLQRKTQNYGKSKRKTAIVFYEFFVKTALILLKFKRKSSKLTFLPCFAEFFEKKSELLVFSSLMEYI